MSLSENGNGLVMPVGPMYGNGSTNGFGWGDGSFWIIILFLFAFIGNGWGNWGGNSGTTQTINNDVQRGFDQQAVMSGLNGINASVTNGFADAEISRCNAQANVLQTLNGMAMNMQNCCCENRAQAADLKYTIATENCADRAAISDGIRDVIDASNRNYQGVIDKLCQLELDAKNDKIADLERQLTMANLAASQTAQTGRILADNAAQTMALEQYLNPTPIPAYVVQNPNCCAQNGCGCNTGCGCGGF